MARFRRILFWVPFAVIGLIAGAALLHGVLNSGPRLSVSGLGTSIVAESGPIVRGIHNGNAVEVLAAASEPDLCGLMLALGDVSSDLAAKADPCWTVSSLPSNSLFLAVDALVPCQATDLTVGLRGNRLELAASYRSRNCPPGSGATARPSFSLVAIPLRNLPATVLTIDPAGATTLVDLRPPLQPQDVQTRFLGAGLAIDEVAADLRERSAQTVTELSIMSWTDAGLGCLPGNPGDGIRRWGYEVMVGDLTYRWTPGLLVFCGPARNGRSRGVRPIVDPNLFLYRDLVAADSMKLDAAWLRDSLAVVQQTRKPPTPSALAAAARQFSTDLSGLVVSGPLMASDHRLRAALQALETDLDTIASNPGSSLTTEVWFYDPVVANYGYGTTYQEVKGAEAAVARSATPSNP